MISSDDSATISLWDDLKTHLEQQKRAATLDIRNYPQPIAGCDAQIPALWERRDGLVAALDRLAALNAGGSVEDLRKFVLSCSSLNDEEKQKFAIRLKARERRSAAE